LKSFLIKSGNVIGRDYPRAATHAADVGFMGGGKDGGLTEREHRPGEIASTLVGRCLLGRRRHWRGLDRLIIVRLVNDASAILAPFPRHPDRMDASGDVCVELSRR
jgi:hypothetical protein